MSDPDQLDLELNAVLAGNKPSLPNPSPARARTRVHVEPQAQVQPPPPPLPPAAKPRPMTETVLIVEESPAIIPVDEKTLAEMEAGRKVLARYQRR